MRTAVFIVLAILLAFFLVRLPLLVSPGIFLGWNSDAAIFGLMAKKMVEGRGFDVFFWGQNYLGSLTSMLIAAVGAARELLGFRPAVDGLALRLGTSLTVAIGVIFLWMALRAAGVMTATLLALFLAIGPPALYRVSVIPIGAEMVFLLGSIVVWVGARQLERPEERGPLARRTALQGPLSGPWGRFGFGVLAGVGTWMNQGVLFFVAAVLIVLALRAPAYSDVRARVRIKDRLLFRAAPLGWKGLSQTTRVLLLILEVILAAELLYLILRDTLGWWWMPSPGFRWPFGEPLMMLILLHLLVAVWQRDTILSPINWTSATRLLAPGIAGFLVGYAPVLLGRWLNWYPSGHSFSARFNYPREALETFLALFTVGVPALWGIDWRLIGIVTLAVLGLVMLWLLERRREMIAEFLQLQPRDYGAAGILFAAGLLNIVYVLFTQRAPFKAHYVVAAMPAAWLIVALGIQELWRSADRPVLRKLAAAGAGVWFVASLGIGSAGLIGEVLSEPDPRPVIERLERAGCEVCYAEFWTAYKYRFLTNESILFIVYQSQDRSPQDSARFRSAPGRRCLLEPDGTVRIGPTE